MYLIIVPAVVLLACLTALSWLAGTDAPFVVTVNTKHFQKILKLAGVKKGSRFYDLGSGDGRLVLAAAKLGADSFGIEQSFLRVLWSRWKARKLVSPDNYRGNLKFIHGNIFSQNYSDADIIYFYLLQKAADKLETKLRNELPKNSIVIIKADHFKNWDPIKIQGDFCIYRA